MSKPQVIVIGAGFTGLAAARDLVRAGFAVTVLEAQDCVGGLAGAFATEGERLDRFYHHWFNSDREIMQLVSELGLEDQVTWQATRTGIYYNRSVYRLSSPGDLLRFQALPLVDRLRLGLLYLRARRVRDWQALEEYTAAEWLKHLGGHNVWRVVWEPLLRGKFGPWADRVSAVWFWNKIKLRGGSRSSTGREQLGYFQGSFARLAEALAQAIHAAGAVIRLSSPVSELSQGERGQWEVRGHWGALRADAVVITTAPALAAEMLASAAPQEALTTLRRTPYLANLCLVLELDRSLGSTYWLNVNDPHFPYVGVIEHTQFQHPACYGGRHVVYLSKYLVETDPLYQLTDAEVMDFSVPHLTRMFPAFRKEWVQRFHVWRARWAQPVVEPHYSALLPPKEGLLPGIFMTSMAHIYPEDRGTNHAVREGRGIAALVSQRLRREG